MGGRMGGRLKRLVRSRAVLALALLDVVFHTGFHGPTEVSGRSFSAALAAQQEITGEWLALDGVVGTAVGSGEGGDAVLVVYLTRPGAAALPATWGGVPVRTEVTGPFKALGEVEPAAAGADSDDPRRGFPRPVPIGVSTGHIRVTAGTIGARVTDGLRVYALSNNHVYANSNDASKGDLLLQPGVVDGGRDPDDALGTLDDFEPIRFCNRLGCPYNQMDAALALTTPDDVGFATPSGGYGAPRSRALEPSLNLKVQKYGRTTGHTKGRLTGLNATVDVSYRGGTARFEGQIVIAGGGFSDGGDSGSLIVSDGVLATDRRPVGLLFAGSSVSTLANPIGPVLDRFGVTVDGG